MPEIVGYIVKNADKLGIITRDPTNKEALFFSSRSIILPGDIVGLKLGKGTYRLKVDILYITPPLDVPGGVALGVECNLEGFFPRGSYIE